MWAIKRVLALVLTLAVVWPAWVLAKISGPAPHAAAPARLLASHDPPPQRLVAYRWAVTQRGKPYCWGGTGQHCYDCSGLVMEAYRRAGIWLPRTTAEMQRYRRLYHIHRPRAGDIVLYGRPAFHVALYAGHGRIFDALNQATPVGWQPRWWPGRPHFYRVRGANA
jgi:cell wall-associated NlpC family hydrolase